MYGLLLEARRHADVKECYPFGQTHHLIAGEGFDAGRFVRETTARGFRRVTLRPVGGGNRGCVHKTDAPCVNRSYPSGELSKRFGDFTAVDRISFDVARGEIFGFLGANGAGKTTAMRMLCGLSYPTSGSGTVAGYDVMREGGGSNAASAT